MNTQLMPDIEIKYGGLLKAVVGDDEKMLGEGWAVIFNEPDSSELQDIFLPPPQCEYGFKEGESRLVAFHHGFDGVFNKEKIGIATLEVKEKGIWANVELSDTPKGRAAYQSLKAGELGFSSAGQWNLIERRPVAGGRHEITQWPLGELSLTRTPQHKGARAYSLKALIEHTPATVANSLKFWDSYYDSSSNGISTLLHNLARLLDAPLELLNLEAIAAQMEAGATVIRSGNLSASLKSAPAPKKDEPKKDEPQEGEAADTPKPAEDQTARITELEAALATSQADNAKLTQRLEIADALFTTEVEQKEKKKNG